MYLHFDTHGFKEIPVFIAVVKEGMGEGNFVTVKAYAHARHKRKGFSSAFVRVYAFVLYHIGNGALLFKGDFLDFSRKIVSDLAFVSGLYRGFDRGKNESRVLPNRFIFSFYTLKERIGTVG